MRSLSTPVAENAIIRPGHQPFTRTIGDILKDRADESVENAFLRDDLETIRRGRHPRNTF